MSRIEQKFDYIKINLASPKRILEWGQRILPNGEIIGEVTKSETINYRSFKPEKDGLFCERIFGPTKNWECYCEKTKRIDYVGNSLFCEYCGVEITESRVRRHRMGFIELVYPVTHIWYLKGMPSYMSIFLDEDRKTLEKEVYLCNDKFPVPKDDFNFERKEMKIGAPSIKKRLESIDIGSEIERVRKNLLDPNYNPTLLSRQKGPKKKYVPKEIIRKKLLQRLRILENFEATGSNPAWMILSILPVIPPGLRPLVQLEGGRFATSDLNELYRRIITRNNRLKRWLNRPGPSSVLRVEKRLIQEAVDALIDNGKRGTTALGANNRPLRSLSDIIKGKQGRFRQNLLGKRVDYSGRSVIVVGPTLKLNQCGLPFEIVIELFQSFIIHEFLKQGLASTMRVAKKIMNQNEPLVSSVVEKILVNHPIFLNRAPTLHRLGIQAFEPILVEGRAIKLHPLVCSAFNADFDGDQMAVHVPLSLEAQAEAYILMLAPYNFLSPATGQPIIVPSQDMILGCYYLTSYNIKNLRGSNHYFSNIEDVILAYTHEQLELHSLIWVRYDKEVIIPKNLLKIIKLSDNTYIEYYENIQIRKKKNGEMISLYLQTTVGRILFNNIIQKTLNFLSKFGF